MVSSRLRARQRHPDYIEGRQAAAEDVLSGKANVWEAILSFLNDPADSQGQLGYLHEMLAIRNYLHRRAVRLREKWIDAELRA